MAFIPKPNTGTLWPNDKTSPNQPDVRGDIHIDRAFLKMLMQEDGELVKITIAGWNKTIAGKECISMAASEPYKKKVVLDEDVPF